jgi:MFS family permease
LWFASNAVMQDLVADFSLGNSALGHLTSFVQFGFITGTFLFAIFTIADRFLPSKVFFICAILGAMFNLGLLREGNSFNSIAVFRFFTGFFLAGIYPVGMKIASDYFDKGLGKSLGFLVGALVLGTAFPHLIKSITAQIPWEYVILLTSLLAVLGGLIIVLFIPLGPYHKKSSGIELSAFFKVFKVKAFRQAATGYFGHMWELYAFWAFVPVLISSFNVGQGNDINISLWSFIIIAVGSFACVGSGFLSERFGTKKVASFALALSGLSCLVLPLVFSLNNTFIFLLFLLVWGMAVIADSPLFSTLVAKNAPVQYKGTALTIVNCIGFAITILSIELLTYLSALTDTIFVYSVLALGPVLGLYKLWR